MCGGVQQLLLYGLENSHHIRFSEGFSQVVVEAALLPELILADILVLVGTAADDEERVQNLVLVYQIFDAL